MAIYKITEKFPKSEIYGLTSQMKRSALSISSNIAEGSLRGSQKDFLRFLFIAYGSGAELQTQLEVSKMLNFINETDFEKVYSDSVEIMKMLNVFIRKIKIDVKTNC